MQRRKRLGKGAPPLEKQEQIRVVNYAYRKGIYIFSVPNGGSRNMLEAINLKKQGMVAGIPDLIIPMARKGYHSLYIEMKRTTGGALSEHQQYWIDVLNKEGMLAIVCKGADEAIRAIEDYFAL